MVGLLWEQWYGRATQLSMLEVMERRGAKWCPTALSLPTLATQTPHSCMQSARQKFGVFGNCPIQSQSEQKISTFCNSLQENLDWKWDFQHRDCQYATAILWRWLSWLSHTSLNITAKILWPSFSKAQAKMCDLLLLHHSIISELCSSLLTWP